MPKYGAIVRLTAACLLVATSVTAHDENILDPHNATHGVRLELNESPRAKAAAAVRYTLRVTGISRDVVLNLWTQDFGSPFRKVASDLRLDEFGNVVSGRSVRTGQPDPPIRINPGPYPLGAVWSIALVSVDGGVRTFAAVIPRPIISRSGTCMIQLELVSYRGDRFVVTGAGFPPEDEVTVESQYAGRMIEKRKTVSSEGRLPLEVLAHDAAGPDHNARYVVKSKSCTVAIDYRWGTSALVRR